MGKQVIFMLMGILGGLHLGQAQFECACPEVWHPVCCSDGSTYENEYCIECINSHPDFPGPAIEVVSEGSCTEEYECVVPSIFNPVCGTDGVTYSNIEALDCRNNDPNNDENVDVWYEGICPSPECVVLAIWAPVCASDGNTYDNEYVVNCINETNPNHPLDIVSSGSCEESWTIQP